ncbi:hypothetical protein AAHB49_03750 [Bacillus cereus]
MKNTFSRLFGFGDKESEFELQDESHEEIDKKVYEEIQEIPIVNITLTVINHEQFLMMRVLRN